MISIGWAKQGKTERGTPRERLEARILAMLERDWDPAGVPPNLRVTGVDVSYSGGKRVLKVTVSGIVDNFREGA